MIDAPTDAGGDTAAIDTAGNAGEAAAAPDAAAAAPAAWHGTLSDEARDNAPSDKAWMETKGFTDPVAMIKSYRSLEGKLSASKGVEVPGEGATPEQVAAYRSAIGVPDSADGYAVEVPAGWEADLGVLAPLREAAHSSGMPKGAWDGLVNTFKQQAMDRHNALVDGMNAERDTVYQEWAGQKDQNIALHRRGMEALGLNADEVQAWQAALGAGGVKRILDLGVKLGRWSNDDGFIETGKRDFGVTSDQARVELDQLEKDPAFRTKLFAKDPQAKAQHDRLLAIISEDEQRKARAA